MLYSIKKNKGCVADLRCKMESLNDLTKRERERDGILKILN